METPLYAATAPRAIEAAEGDLLGQALGALELWFQYDDGELDNGIDLMASYAAALDRSEEHTSELQSLMRISYAVFCLKNKITFHLYSMFYFMLSVSASACSLT